MLNFPNIQEIVSLAGTNYEKEFIQLEYQFSLKYYLNRIDQIMLSGERVLDAACGVGQWSIALSQRFSQVEAIDVNPDRLAVLKNVTVKMGVENIAIQQVSIEKLPYEDCYFDAVFCYGAIMFTQIDVVLTEFFRVLKPKGRVYLCLNADGWSKYLIYERGKQNESIRLSGQETLYNTYLRRALRRGIFDILAQDLKRLSLIFFIEQKDFCTIKNIKSNSISRFVLQAQHFISKNIASLFVLAITFFCKYNKQSTLKLLCKSEVGSELFRDITKIDGNPYYDLLLSTVQSFLRGTFQTSNIPVTRAYLPSEIEYLVETNGFRDFQWAAEGCLVCDFTQPNAESKYQSYYNGELSVWECLFVKPQAMLVKPSVNYHFNLASNAKESRLLCGFSSPMILCNTSETYPKHLLDYNRKLASDLGGDRYLRDLTRTIIDKATEDEEVVRNIIVFVQKAIFRDPVSQPYYRQQGLPDALTTLLCARGRCGHIANVLMALFKFSGMESRLIQFPRHIAVELKLKDRWVIVDADAFKNGVIPVNQQHQMLTMDELRENSFQLDRFPTTGWFIQPKSRFTKGISGFQVTGYVDALTFDMRGFISGYYVPKAFGYPPSLPLITEFYSRDKRFYLSWIPSTVHGDLLVGYRVRVGTISRGWSYDFPGDNDEILRQTSDNVFSGQTIDNSVSGDIPEGVTRLFAAVSAISSRIEQEPNTYFWSSEEVVLNVA